jgi:hypothetical protein
LDVQAGPTGVKQPAARWKRVVCQMEAGGMPGGSGSTQCLAAGGHTLVSPMYTHWIVQVLPMAVQWVAIAVQ